MTVAQLIRMLQSLDPSYGNSVIYSRYSTMLDLTQLVVSPRSDRDEKSLKEELIEHGVNVAHADDTFALVEGVLTLQYVDGEPTVLKMQF